MSKKLSLVELLDVTFKVHGRPWWAEVIKVSTKDIALAVAGVRLLPPGAMRSVYGTVETAKSLQEVFRLWQDHLHERMDTLCIPGVWPAIYEDVGIVTLADYLTVPEVARLMDQMRTMNVMVREVAIGVAIGHIRDRVRHDPEYGRLAPSGTATP